jgi:hypothetical protein
VAARPQYLHASSGDAFLQHPVLSSGPLRYVPFDRTYKGLPVIGGDFVVVTDAAGHVSYTSVAQTRAIGALATTPTLSAAEALGAAARVPVASPSSAGRSGTPAGRVPRSPRPASDDDRHGHGGPAGTASPRPVRCTSRGP